MLALSIVACAPAPQPAERGEGVRAVRAHVRGIT